MQRSVGMTRRHKLSMSRFVGLPLVTVPKDPAGPDRVAEPGLRNTRVHRWKTLQPPAMSRWQVGNCYRFLARFRST